MKQRSLTKEEKRAAERAIYGLDQNMEQSFSHEDLERMRTILREHDQQSSKGIREFDLNNPPREPYVHQEYPKMLYHHGERQTAKVHNAGQEHGARAEGWTDEPFPREASAPADAVVDEAAEIEALDKIARKPRKKE